MNNYMEEKGVSEMLSFKSLDQIVDAKAELVSNHKRPRYLHMSPSAYMSLMSLLGPLLIEDSKFSRKEKTVTYGGMEVVVDNKMEEGTFNIICSVDDELLHFLGSHFKTEEITNA